ncbi:hypothetical protein [Streptomyces hydrogenans]|uniref:hypothetical protein n=1 Tax=Streptomyces hydrogenans TaxID=1873719 RepID=UPI0038214447
MRITTKKRLLTAGITCVIAVCAVLGYVEIFTKGIDRLPEKPCSGAVDRDLAARALPSARKAEERGKLLTSSQSIRAFMFACYVRTDDSIISGEADAGILTPEAWRKSKSSEELRISVSVNGIHALSLEDEPETAWVYVPCTPPSHAGDRDAGHSLIAQARTLGETRAHGDELRQILVDFAYQLARHAYEVGECQEPREFPERLPRISTK